MKQLRLTFILLIIFIFSICGASFAQITGNLLICGIDKTTSLAGVPFGGTWTSATMSVATVNVSTGIVTSASPGTTVITYLPSGATVTVTVAPTPTLYNFYGGGTTCGCPGPNVYLSNTTTGINYQLYCGGTAVGTSQVGTGSAYNFGPICSDCSALTAVATNTVTGCSSMMTGSVSVTINALPTASYNIMGGGASCGSPCPDVTLSNTQSGINYQLYCGGTAVGTSQVGTGSAYNFGPICSDCSALTAVATNTVTGCSSTMTGSVSVTANPLPIAYTVGGSGAICAGGTATITLSSSQSFVTYEVLLGGVSLSPPVTAIGTGGPLIILVPNAQAGTYTIIAVNTTTGCTNTMTGSAVITVTASPNPYSLMGGGVSCGCPGPDVYLSGSDVAVGYQLYCNGVPYGSELPGTGITLDFGHICTNCVFTALATSSVTGCSSMMTGSVSVTVNPPPTAYTAGGGGTLCAGGAGLYITLPNSQTGVEYQLYLNGSPVVPTVTVPGITPFPITFPAQTAAGVYTIVATNITTLCTNTMTGSAVITVNASPNPYNLIGGGVSCGCPGPDVSLSSSDLGINYQLYCGGVPYGPSWPGTLAPIDFGHICTTCVFTAVATNTVTGCSSIMTGSISVTVNPLPVAYTVTGGGSACPGPCPHISLSSSQAGVSYQFYGCGLTGSSVLGPGPIDFGPVCMACTYTVVATNMTTLCTNTMTGSATVTNTPDISTFAGNGAGGYSGDTHAAILAELKQPLALVVDAADNVYIADGNNNVIRKVTAGTITTYAGDYTLGAGYSGDGGTAVMAQLNVPGSVAVDGSGNVYIADGNNYVIRKVNPAGTITTIAGNYAAGAGYSGDGGPATAAQLKIPTGIAVDLNGNIYIADFYSNVIRKVNVSTGIITTFAGNNTAGYSGDGGPATTAELNGPYSVTVDVSGNVYIADANNNVVRKVNPAGTITTIAGNHMAGAGYSGDGAAAVSARLNYPSGVAVDLNGNIYIADFGNNVVRKVEASSGYIATIAGNYTLGGGYSGDGGVATAARLNTPAGVAVDGCGNLYIADYGNNVVRYVPACSPPVPVAGAVTLCEGASFVLNGATGSSNTAVAGVNTITGLVAAGATPGTATISYAMVCSGTPVSATVIVTVVAPPTTYTVTGGGTTCGGICPHIGLSNSQAGVTYYLYGCSGTPVAVTSTSGGALDFGAICTACTYTVMATNAGGCTTMMTGNATVTNSSLISTIAGNGGSGYAGDGGLATAADLFWPIAVAVDQAGNKYIADGGNNVIRKVTPAGIISTYAGNGTAGFAGDGGAANSLSCELNNPQGIAVDQSGNLYIADQGNNRIRYVNASTGIIITFAGNGTHGYAGDYGTATFCELGSPIDVAVDLSNNVYIDDYDNNVIRIVTPSSSFGYGYISTYAGNGTAGYSGDGGPANAAELNQPYAAKVDINGNLYIADTHNQRIRKVDATGMITTFAGDGYVGYTGDAGPAVSAELSYPGGVATDVSGNVYISGLNDNKIRKVDVSGIITTYAGDGTGGYSGDGGPATAAELNWPYGAAVDDCGDLYIADYNNNRVRYVAACSPPVPVVGSATLYVNCYGGGGGLPTTLIINGATASSNPAVASVNTATGLVSAATMIGATTISYTLCGIHATIIVTTQYNICPSLLTPPSATVCIGHSTALSDPTPGGVWSSSAPAIATVGSTGVVTGVAGGTAIITYSIPGGTATGTVTVNGIIPMPVPVSTGGTICGGACPDLVFSNTQAGATYQLYGCGGASVIATGTTVNFGPICASCNYSITATYAGCTYDYPPGFFRVTPSPDINLVAGDGSLGSTGDGGSAISAELYLPGSVAVDQNGNLYIADAGNNKIRFVNASSGVISTFAGTGAGGNLGDGGAPGLAELNQPTGVAVDQSGNVYIADEHNNKVREVVALTGNIITFAGTGTGGYSGDGGLAASAELNNPIDVAVDVAGNVYISDNGNNVIREVNVYNSAITTIAGTGIGGYNGDGIKATSAELNNPYQVNVDVQGNVYIADQGNNVIRKVDATSNHTITTFAGTATMSGYGGDGGLAALYGVAKLISPSGVAVDVSGNVFIADEVNARIREVTISNGFINTIAGNGTPGYIGNGGLASAAEVYWPVGMAVDGCGNLFSTDLALSWVREIPACSPPVPEPGSVTMCQGATFTTSPGASSNNTLVAIVSAGVVIGVMPGTATISYAVCAPNPVPATLNVTVVVCPATGVKNINAPDINSLAVYPNPNQGSFTINLSTATNEDAQIIITNIMGEKVKEFTMPTNIATDVPLNVPAGMYLINASTANGRWIEKVTIDR